MPTEVGRTWSPFLHFLLRASSPDSLLSPSSLSPSIFFHSRFKGNLVISSYWSMLRRQLKGLLAVPKSSHFSSRLSLIPSIRHLSDQSNTKKPEVSLAFDQIIVDLFVSSEIHTFFSYQSSHDRPTFPPRTTLGSTSLSSTFSLLHEIQIHQYV